MKYDPQKISSYFKNEKKVLSVVTISGICYNVGMAAGPYFEGQLAQYLYDIIKGNKRFIDILMLALVYVGVIAFVQFSRFIKRFSVRRFANNVNRALKTRIYQHIVHLPTISHEEVGSAMTKAISDAETCTEGMRKATTEVFDTGVVMVVYLVMLFSYDWRLSLMSLIFPPVAYVIAIHLRKLVARSTAAARESAGQLNDSTLDLTSHALTYRVYGCEAYRRQNYERVLDDYEEKSIAANIWNDSLQPIYLAIAMAGLIPILYFGARNVLHIGWRTWNIAAFSTYVTCFTKLAKKTSSGAKLFNAVQKAQVSWGRIRDDLVEITLEDHHKRHELTGVSVKNLSFAYPEDHHLIFHDVSFDLHQGEIIGMTGQIASGKSTLGKVFLNEYPYQGSIRLTDDQQSYELRDISIQETNDVAYVGHDYELFNMSLADNIRLGLHDNINPSKDSRLLQVIDDVCFTDEVKQLSDGFDTLLGDGGEELSGGQKQRIALARALYHSASLYVLDDPFSAVDSAVERQILKNLRTHYSDKIILLISHRLTFFPLLDQVIWLENGKAIHAGHEEMLKISSTYRNLYLSQSKGCDLDD